MTNVINNEVISSGNTTIIGGYVASTFNVHDWGGGFGGGLDKSKLKSLKVPRSA